METDFIYCRRKTPIGVKIEEITGSEQRSGRIWREMARQVWNENGRDEYRSIGHFSSGAPFNEADPDSRISLSHTEGMLVVATLPPAPQIESQETFNPLIALGVDTERTNRDKPHALRSRFLNETELTSLPDTPESSLLAWTAKEALYKAALTPGLDWRADICIMQLPDPATGSLGRASVRINGEEQPFTLYSYREGEFTITIALGVNSVTFLSALK